MDVLVALDIDGSANSGDVVYNSATFVAVMQILTLEHPIEQPQVLLVV